MWARSRTTMNFSQNGRKGKLFSISWNPLTLAPFFWKPGVNDRLRRATPAGLKRNWVGARLFSYVVPHCPLLVSTRNTQEPPQPYPKTHRSAGKGGKNLPHSDCTVCLSHPSPNTRTHCESMVQPIYTFWHPVTAELFWNLLQLFSSLKFWKLTIIPPPSQKYFPRSKNMRIWMRVLMV